jgi:hypothetical protein
MSLWVIIGTRKHLKEKLWSAARFNQLIEQNHRFIILGTEKLDGAHSTVPYLLVGISLIQ